MRRAAPLLLAAVLSGLAGCGVSTEGSPITVDDDRVPFGLLTTSTTTTVTTTTTTPPTAPVVVEGLTVCFHRGAAVEPVVRSPAEPGATAALEALLGGPTTEEAERGLSTAAFDPGVAVGVRVAGGIATVALGPAFTEAGAAVQLDVIVELVCTMTAQPGVGQVAFELEEQRVEVPREDGALTAEPVSRDDYPSLLA